ncbi:AI-2E family transporter [Pedobacter sp. BMA]|uniref:AI-2E family transporter n=1 Tax=Pedobacter sp. BMA TaxID=1663685 RepID=UPI00064B0430|nr:AI-2E family transporter [Pedobacter sp. BMA]KLT63586.1 permease [Pedobacter sp. BMA]
MDIKFAQKPFYVKTMCVLVSLIAVGYLVIIAKEILSPLIFSCLFSILLLPMASFFEYRLKLPRSAASMLSVILMLAAIGLVLYVIGSQLTDLANDWPQFRAQLNITGQNLQKWIDNRFHIDAAKQLNYVHSATSKALASSTTVVGATVLSLSSILLFLVFTFIYTFFFLLYRTLIMKFLVSVFLEENKKMVYDIIEQVQYIIRKYIIGLLIEMAIVATVVSIVFWFLGIKYAILLGLITGILNIIPYIGIFVALILSTLITFATATILSKVILVIVTLIIVHLIDSNVILPLVVGSKVRINALITVLGVIIGEMVWGISGMFLSIPVIAVLKIIFDRVESMKPWGIILGDEEKKQNRLAKKLSPKKKLVTE